MAFLCVLIYIVLLSACGCFFLRKWKMEPLLLLPAGFVIGSILMGVGMFLLVSASLVSPIPVSILVAGVFVLGIFGAPTMFRSLKEIKRFLFSHVYVGRYRLVLAIILLIGLALYLADAYTPPRSADAMRYHLAQVKETVKYGGFVFRPYYHYNFPQYFHYLFIPTFMLAGGVSVKLAVYFYFILVILAILQLSFRTKQTKHLLLLALFFTFMPITIMGATVAGNDMPVVLYGLVGLLLILNSEPEFQLRYLILAYASLGFALGCKYHALLYFPVYILATFLVIQRRWKLSFRHAIIIPLIVVSFLVASPFLIRNLHYTGDPVWPLLQDLFHVKKDYLYQITQFRNRGFQGQLGFAALIKSITELATSTFFIPVVWVLWLGYYFTRFPSGLLYKVGALSYFLVWFLLQPVMYPRYAFYIFPIIAIMAISFCEWFYSRNSLLGKGLYALVLLSVLVGIGFSVLYSLDFLEYHVGRDLKKYHRFTSFYDQHQWINQNLKDDGKVLTILMTGQTYYIDKEYLRAEPELSGLIDWMAVKDLDELLNVLREWRVRYVLYEDRNWSRYPGGSNMVRLIKDLKDEDGVSILFDNNNVELVTLRILRKGFRTRVFLLDLQGLAKPA